ncbi:MAG TPA: DsrE family protein [Thiolinea sp.]|nr:DsrE family protein [Thiolinea sp.]
MKTFSPLRRHLLGGIGLIGSFLALKQAHAEHTDTHLEEDTAHKLVMNCNKADAEYLEHTLFSVGELIRRYGDDIHVIVECYGPGLHLLGRNPGRPVAEELQQRASSLSHYGVGFHACGNTLKGLNWREDDLLPFAKVVEAGIEDMMLLQEQGFAYAGW